MNADILSANTSDYKKLEKESKAHHNPTDLQEVQPDRTFDNLNQFPAQKRKPHINSTQPSSNASPSSTKNIYSTTGKHPAHKLVDSKQLKPFNQSDKKTFLFDTYARIVATNNRRCSKRLRDLAKPKRQVYNDRNDDSINFNLNWHTGKANTAKARRDSENSKMRQLY